MDVQVRVSRRKSLGADAPLQRKRKRWKVAGAPIRRLARMPAGGLKERVIGVGEPSGILAAAFHYEAAAIVQRSRALSFVSTYALEAW